MATAQENLLFTMMDKHDDLVVARQSNNAATAMMDAKTELDKYGALIEKETASHSAAEKMEEEVAAMAKAYSDAINEYMGVLP